MRNRLSILALLMLFVAGINAQNLMVSGTVTNQLTGAPMPNHEVFIQTDSIAGGVIYYNTVATDPNGSYEDVIPLNSPAQGLLYVSTTDCNGSWLTQQLAYGPNNYNLTANFSICGDTIPVGCQSDFYYYSDSSSAAIHFVDASVGDPSSWLWEFGDGATSVEQNPTHTYALPGEYLATLTISTTTGCSSTSTQMVWVGVPPVGCQAMFAWQPADTLPGFVPNQISFFDLSTGTPATWFWDFGDGTSSSEQNPVHVYLQPGDYMVCLTISSNDSSCNDMICQPVFVGMPPFGCQANFYYFPGDTSNINTLNTFQFVDASQGDPTSWLWNFGDGTTSTEQNPTHTYAVPAIYHVCLTIQNADSNCFDTFCEEVWTGNPIPGCQAMYFYYPADSLGQSNTIQFVDQSIGDPAAWFWNFGDGSTSDEQHPIHQYSQPGIYNVCLTIVNPAEQCTDTICLEVWVNNLVVNCENAFYYEPVSLTVTFNGYMIDGDTATYTWEFGDGATSTGQTATHTYAAPGIYPVMLTTLTNGGCEFTSSQLVFVGDTMSMQTIQGQVMAGSANSVEGVVLLMPLTGIWNWGAQVAMIDSSGYYHFDGVMPGSYHILALPFSVNGDTTAYLPTYYGDVVFWEQASVVTLGTALPAYDIHLVACNGILPGLGLINGSITGNGLKSGMSDVNILLLDSQNQPLVFDRSDAAGSFNFNTLAYGTYTIWAEMHGVNTTPVTLTLSPETPSVTVNLKLSGSSVMGIGDQIPDLATVKDVYPNPVNDKLNIDLTAKKAVNTTLTIYSMTGQAMAETVVTISGNETVVLDTQVLNVGIYSLVIRTDDGTTIRQKFVKASR